MKRKKAGDMLFSLFVIVTMLIAVIPLLFPKIFGHIWSWEGFFRSWQTQGIGKWMLCCGVMVIASILILLVVRIPKLIWRTLLSQKINLKVKLCTSKKVHSLFALRPQRSKLELTFGEGEVSFSLYKESGKLKWGVLCVAAAIVLAVFPRSIPLTARWFEKYDLVAHAGGTSPNGNTYVNSLEAFEYNYQQGFRVFEGDLCLTADGVLVLAHYWGGWNEIVGIEYKVPSYDEFMLAKLFGTETPMDLTALMDLMIAHEDMYFMTDFKNSYQKDTVVSAFQQIVQAAKDANRMDVLDRFIIQNHHKDFKHWVDEVYSFENWLYTWYSIPVVEDGLPENMVAYCENENIPVITMWHNMANDDWFELTQPRNIKIFVHTVNDVVYANELISDGVTGIYTDDIRPGQLQLR